MSLTIVGCMLCLVMVAGFIGLLTAHVLGLDASAFVHMPSMLTTEEVNKTAAVSIPQLVTSLIPTNIFLDLTGARSVSVIGIVIFTLIAGIALLKVKKEAPEEGQKLSAGINAIQIWVMKMVRIVIALTPYGVMALMTTVFSSYHFEQFASLLGFIGACYIAIFMMFIVHAILLILSGNNPARYFRMVWPVLTFAFVSRSSAASIPLAISAQEKFGVQSTIANISASFGSSYGAKWLRRDLSGYYGSDDCAHHRHRSALAAFSGRDVACHCARVYWRSRRRRRWYVRGADCPVDVEFSRCAGRYFYCHRTYR
ncbi:C4-dicarboxylate transport protein [Salmonella enterica subsp. enterica]|uniref:C4-dicarboxylate transport protein n=1 Tax=Salmonella enterica I TaxID=59201 RepID=A0A379URI4_SALET|nr:C4-dicarboxylate transport protein [Salmonella enterica subsp. enterica]